MSLWKDNSPNKPAVAAAPDARENVRGDATPRPEPSPFASTARTDAGAVGKESLIGADLIIEGKIEGAGSVRIAGKFKGDVVVQGDLVIESGAKVTGSVKAGKVVIAGELEGSIEGAAHVDLQQSGMITGDVTAGSFAVASGARMRGHANFGWEDSAARPQERSEKASGTRAKAEFGSGA